MEKNTIVSKIEYLIKKGGYWYEIFEHPPVRTSEEASHVRPGYTLKQGAKSIIVRIKGMDNKKSFIMLVFSGDKRFSNDRVKAITSAKDIRFATEDEVATITNGVLPGGVPPFGSIFNIKTYVDIGLFHNEKIVFNAGDKSVSIGMYSKDYQGVEKPNITQIV